MGRAEDTLARRQVLQAGVVSAVLLGTDGACEDAPPSAFVDDGGHDGTALDAVDVATDPGADGPDDASPSDSPPEATRVDGSGTCMQTDYTHPVSILGAGIEEQGTSVAFYDDRYLDPVCSGSRILLINPLTKEGYVALSGVCTHQCCDYTGGEGGPTYLTTYTPADGGVLKDVVRCSCHGAVFSALDGSVIFGDGMNPLATGLQVLPTCAGGGFVFVSIPPRPR
jgi:nitrite reductase/ring-hydroxylating ferredoxin subunit